MPQHYRPTMTTDESSRTVRAFPLDVRTIATATVDRLAVADALATIKRTGALSATYGRATLTFSDDGEAQSITIGAATDQGGTAATIAATGVELAYYAIAAAETDAHAATLADIERMERETADAPSIPAALVLARKRAAAGPRTVGHAVTFVDVDPKRLAAAVRGVKTPTVTLNVTAEAVDEPSARSGRIVPAVRLDMTVIAGGARLAFGTSTLDVADVDPAAADVDQLAAASLGRMGGMAGRWDVDAATLDVLARVLPSTSTDTARPVLRCVAVMRSGMVAATDSYRLAWSDDAVPTSVAERLPCHFGALDAAADRSGLLLPRELVAELLRNGTDGVRVAWSADGRTMMRTDAGVPHLAVAWSTTRGPKRSPRTVRYAWWDETAPGAYPNVRLLIDGAYERHRETPPVVMVDRTGGVLVDAARAAAAAIRSVGFRNCPVRIYGAPRLGARLAVRIQDGDVYAATPDGVELMASGGETAVGELIAANAEYLVDALDAAADGGPVRVLIDATAGGSVRPMIIERSPDAPSDGGPTVRVLLMPMRT